MAPHVNKCKQNVWNTMAKQPEDLFRENGGRLHMSEAIGLGMSRYMLYALRDRGVIEQVSRGSTGSSICLRLEIPIWSRSRCVFLAEWFAWCPPWRFMN